MKLKIVGLAVLGLLAAAAVAQAAGVFDNAAASNQRLARQKVLTRKAESVEQLARVRRGPRGPRGPKGSAGSTGPAGPKGSFSTITQVSGPETFICNYELACSIGSAHAECPPGTRVISGGWAGAFYGTTYFSFASGNGWSVGVANEGINGTTYHAVALCAA